jgi:hypothetical protein
MQMRQLNEPSDISPSQLRMETWLYPLLLLVLLALNTGIPEYGLIREAFPRAEVLKTLTGQLKVTPRRNLNQVAVITQSGEKISFYCRPWLFDFPCIPIQAEKTGASVEITVRDVPTSAIDNVEAFGVKVNGQETASYSETKDSFLKSKTHNLVWLIENITLFIACLVTIKIKLKQVVKKHSLRVIFVTYGLMYVVLSHIHLGIVN